MSRHGTGKLLLCRGIVEQRRACSLELRHFLVLCSFPAGNAGTRLPRWLWQDSGKVDAAVLDQTRQVRQVAGTCCALAVLYVLFDCMGRTWLSRPELVEGMSQKVRRPFMCGGRIA